jgi:ATP-dependent Zn protease
MDLSKNYNYLEYKHNLENQIKQRTILNNNYNNLKNNNYKINSLMNEFHTINAAYKDKSLIVTSNYYNYIVLLFVSILLILLFLRFSEKENVGGNMKKIFKIN